MKRIGLALTAALLTVAIVAPLALADHPWPLTSCTTNPPFGMNRNHFGLFNLCGTDSYGPPEWMYWNYMPGTPGYNDPGNGPYYSLIAQAVADWVAVQPN